MNKKLAVVGAGNGGQALAGHLALLGHKVNLLEHPTYKEKIEAIREKGSNIQLEGAIKGEGGLEKATVNPEEALEGVEFVFVVAPAFAQRPLIEMIMPFMKAEMKIILIPGNFGSLELMNFFRKENCEKPLLIGETNTLPYACRQKSPGVIDIWGIKTEVLLAVLPSKHNETARMELAEIFPVNIAKAKNVLETSFSNLNMVVHCPTMILNAGRIESERGNFRFYTDGMTPSVCKVCEMVDQERIRVGSRLGLTLQTQKEWLKRSYSLEGDTLYELLQGSPVYGKHGPDAPRILSHRYLTEDVPYLLVPVASFGRHLGIPCPLIESIILIAGVINERDFFSEGRTINKLGLDETKLENWDKLLDEGIC